MLLELLEESLELLEESYLILILILNAAGAA
jgi:hypothetical protein